MNTEKRAWGVCPRCETLTCGRCDRCGGHTCRPKRLIDIDTRLHWGNCCKKHTPADDLIMAISAIGPDTFARIWENAGERRREENYKNLSSPEGFANPVPSEQALHYYGKAAHVYTMLYRAWHDARCARHNGDKKLKNAIVMARKRTDSDLSDIEIGCRMHTAIQEAYAFPAHLVKECTDRVGLPLAEVAEQIGLAVQKGTYQSSTLTTWRAKGTEKTSTILLWSWWRDRMGEVGNE